MQAGRALIRPTIQPPTLPRAGGLRRPCFATSCRAPFDALSHSFERGPRVPSRKGRWNYGGRVIEEGTGTGREKHGPDVSGARPSRFIQLAKELVCTQLHHPPSPPAPSAKPSIRLVKTSPIPAGGPRTGTRCVGGYDELASQRRVERLLMRSRTASNEAPSAIEKRAL